MEGPRNTVTETTEKNNRLVVTLGRVGGCSGSGGGIGVGIIFFGGVLASTAFAFLLGRRRQRRRWNSGDRKNCNSAAAADDDLSTAASTDMDQKKLRDGSSSFSSNTGEQENNRPTISEESFSPRDKNGIFDCDNGSTPIFAVKDKRELQLQDQEKAEGTVAGQSMVVIMYHPITIRFPVPENPSVWDHGKLQNHYEESVGVMGKDQEQERGVTKTNIVEVHGSLFSQHFGINETNQRIDGILLHDQGYVGSTNLIMMAEIEEKVTRKDAHELYYNVMLMSPQNQETRDTTELADDDTASNGGHQTLQQIPESATSLNRDNKKDEVQTPEHSPRETRGNTKTINGLEEVLELKGDSHFVKNKAIICLNKGYKDVGIMANSLLEKRNLDNTSLKLSLLRRYILQLGELTQRTTNLHRRRILAFTAMVLSGSLRVWYFSRPFLKILLMRFRNYLMIKLRLSLRNHLRNHLRIKMIPEMLGI